MSVLISLLNKSVTHATAKFQPDEILCNFSDPICSNKNKAICQKLYDYNFVLIILHAKCILTSKFYPAENNNY